MGGAISPYPETNLLILSCPGQFMNCFQLILASLLWAVLSHLLI